MSWQLLIWNIFSWSFTGVMIYVTQSSMWWLLLPAAFTMTKSAADLVKEVNDVNKSDSKEKDSGVDEETLEQMERLREKAKRGDYRREWI